MNQLLAIKFALHFFTLHVVDYLKNLNFSHFLHLIHGKCTSFRQGIFVEPPVGSTLPTGS